jgi:hypothetical protein
MPDNYFRKYVSEYKSSGELNKKPVHEYTIEIHKTRYTEEVYQLY